MMRILYDHQIFSYQPYGGISRYFYELWEKLRGIDGVSAELGLRFSTNEYLRSGGVPGVRDVLPSLRGGQARLLKFFSYYALNAAHSRSLLRRGGFDIFHPTFYDAYFLPFLHGRPFVATFYDMTPELFPEQFSTGGLYGRFVTSKWIRNKKELARRADAVIAISQNTKNDVVRLFGIAEEKVKVVHLATSFSPDMPESQSLCLPERYMLYVGGRGGYKNFLPFVEAAIPLLRADAALRVVCAGGGAFTIEERRRLNELDVFSRFIRLDMSDAALHILYRKALFFVYPSLYEGFGIPILEAFAAGCPVALSKASCFPEIADEAAVYFEPTSGESIRSALERLARDGGLRQELRVKGGLRLKDFSWRKTADETLSVYQNLIERRER